MAKTPSINKVFHVVTASTVIIIYVLLNWIVDVRLNDFISNQNERSIKTAKTTADEISTYIQNRRNLLNLLNKTYRRELVELYKDPSNSVIRENIYHKILEIFPELIEFNITSKTGSPRLPIISDFKVGKACRRNISNYAKGHLEAVSIHKNPKIENYHFDVLSKISVPFVPHEVLYISLNTTHIENILKRRTPKGVDFFITQGSLSPFIEISAQGHSGLLKRAKKLSELEVKNINANKKIMGTSWNLLSVSQQSSIALHTDDLNRHKNIIVLLTLIAALIVSILFYRTDKKRVAAEIFTLNQNAILEERVQNRTKELTYRATHDSLTDLINRSEFERRLKEALALTKTDNAQSIVMYLDLDQFKVVNDTAGHAAGDELLIQICSLLKSQLRRGDTLARLGGDEFGILLNHCDLERATPIAEQLLAIVHNYEFNWDSFSFTVSVSIGIIEMNNATNDLKELLSLVDAACYMAKEQGRNQFYTYNDNDALFEERHSAMYRAEMALNAIKNGQLELHGQKIVGIKETVHGQNWYEVLVRIKHGDGLMFPDEFIPALEQFGHVSTLDMVVLKKSFAFLAKNPNFKLSINLSALSITKPEFASTIAQALKSNQVEASRVCFEITESAAIGNLKLVKRFIRNIHELGCSIALDDFGTGMSSFGYLSNLDVDYIKLDGSFVKDINQNHIHYTMVEAINSIVDVMGKYIIAEYVVDAEVESLLKEIGISYGQGYHFHRPEKLNNLIL